MNRLLKLESTNVKRLKLVSVTPKGRVFTVGGKNEQGKTSLLDSYAYLVGGKREQCDIPVRKGCDEAKIVGTFDTITVTRRISADGSTDVVIEDASGKIKSPQKLLDEIRPKIGVDPLELERMDRAHQAEVFRAALGLDFSDLDRERAKLLDQRADSGRDVTGRKNQLDQMPEYPEVTGGPVDVTALAKQLQEAEAHNGKLTILRGSNTLAESALRDAEAKVAEGQASLTKCNQRLVSMDNSLALGRDQFASMKSAVDALEVRDTAEIERQIAELQAKLREAHEHNNAVAKQKSELATTDANLARMATDRQGMADLVTQWTDAMTKRNQAVATAKTAVMDSGNAIADFEPIDTAAIQKAIADAGITNGKLQANQQKATLLATFNECKAEYDRLTKEIDAVDAEKCKRINAVKFPVPGLSFGMGGVMLNDLPLDQASSAQRLQVCTAVALAMCPKRDDAIRVIAIRDGSLLDDDHMALLAKMMEDNDAMLLIEVVTTDQGKAEVIIEDGMVKSVNESAGLFSAAE